MSRTALAELDRPQLEPDLHAADLRAALACFERLLRVRDLAALRAVLLPGLAALLGADAVAWRQVDGRTRREVVVGWPGERVPPASGRDDRLTATLERDGGMLTAVTLLRRGRRFTSREGALLMLAAPHLAAAGRRLRAAGQREAQQPEALGLSARQRQVLSLAADGLTDAQVARRLGVSPRTVGKHLQQIYGKLQVTNRVAATRLGRELGLL